MDLNDCAVDEPACNVQGVTCRQRTGSLVFCEARRYSYPHKHYEMFITEHLEAAVGPVGDVNRLNTKLQRLVILLQGMHG